ncbi:RPII140-upstream gene protein [Prorops nasuta]|uniref:RPII140-upstream gene protein n=1 Tax=Prorops nasuta TaxID=863751 RepID=UPI0034CE18B2
MYWIFGRPLFLCGGSLISSKYDVPPVIKSDDDYSIDTGFERLKRLFFSDDPKDSTLRHVILNSSTLVFFVTGISGGIKGSRFCTQDFKEFNQATKFLSHSDAIKDMHIYCFGKFAKGCVKYSILPSLFTLSYLTASICIYTYRGHSGMIEYSLAFSTLGALFKSHLGLRGAISGGVFGLAFGTLHGLIANTCNLTYNDLKERLQYLRRKDDKKRRKQYQSKHIKPENITPENITTEMMNASLLGDQENE